MSINTNRNKTLSIAEAEFKIVATRPLMPGIELIVLRGRKSFTILRGVMFSF